MQDLLRGIIIFITAVTLPISGLFNHSKPAVKPILTPTPTISISVSPTSTLKPKPTNTISNQTDCVGPDGKHFKTSEVECRKFLNAWTTPTPTQVVVPTVNKEDINRACINEDRYLSQIKDECGSTPFPGIDECIKFRSDRSEVTDDGCKDNGYSFPAGMTEAKCRDLNLANANKMKELKPLYLQEKAICDKL